MTDYKDCRVLLTNTIRKIDGAYSPSTIRAYKSDFLELIGYCKSNNCQALPAEPSLIASFIVQLSQTGRKSSSIRRAVAGIATIHRLNRFEDPTKDPEVTLEMKRMHRKLGRSANQAQAITQDILEKLLAATEDGIRGTRDRALLLVAYDTLCRRSELVSLQIEDIKTTLKENTIHMSILLRRSKTDPNATGRWLHLTDRSQVALTSWLERRERSEGPIFRGIKNTKQVTTGLGSGQINRIYKKMARKAGLSEDLVRKISGHSCRVGAAQDLLKVGSTLPHIMGKGRWTKTDTVMRYLEQVDFTV